MKFLTVSHVAFAKFGRDNVGVVDLRGMDAGTKVSKFEVGPCEVIPVGFSLTCSEQRWDAEKMFGSSDRRDSQHSPISGGH